MHRFTSMPLGMKITTLAGLGRQALADRPHLAGMAWSTVSRRAPLPPDEQAEVPEGIALQRGLPIEHVRQTVIINRGLILPDQTRILAQACDREPHWLDWALRRLDVSGGINSLLNQPTQTRESRLWTPASRQ